jgi:hypothetical protein
MPRLPGIKDVSRVSTAGLRLPALQGPAPDPTGAALQGFGQSLGKFSAALGEFDSKQKLLKAAEGDARLRRFDADLMRERAALIASPPEDRSDQTGPDDADPVRRGLRVAICRFHPSPVYTIYPVTATNEPKKKPPIVIAAPMGCVSARSTTRIQLKTGHKMPPSMKSQTHTDVNNVV